ncbi:MAG: hypothetical protein GC182_08705 [Rhodopseudomonas sp.]|nr:hypothetical protein [Rhodopseudomonas sp.]
MTNWIIEPSDIVEPVPAPIVWVEGTCAISLSNGIVTRYLFARHDRLDGTSDRVLELVLKYPAANVADEVMLAAKLTAACLRGDKVARQPQSPPGGFTPHLVKLD